MSATWIRLLVTLLYLNLTSCTNCWVLDLEWGFPLRIMEITMRTEGSSVWILSKDLKSQLNREFIKISTPQFFTIYRNFYSKSNTQRLYTNQKESWSRKQINEKRFNSWFFFRIFFKKLFNLTVLENLKKIRNYSSIYERKKIYWYDFPEK